VVLINKFSWTTYLFGAFLLFTAIKMLFSKEDDAPSDPKDSFVYKTIGKIIPITPEFHQNRFFVKGPKGILATPLFVALVIIEIMDMLFAVDSVPAILAITADPFLVFTSNIFAILGLRSMYFFLANMLEKFVYLEYSLIAILSFVGLKMLFHHYYIVPELISLLVILLSLMIGVFASLRKKSEV
jgi:tellurite resistance protein TerC